MLIVRRLRHPTCSLSTTTRWRNASGSESSFIPPLPVLSEGEKIIHDKLAAKFSPSQLQVQDVSGGCGTFYAITIASSTFKGLPIVKQHKLVTETLKTDIEGFHGLQIRTIAT